MPYLIDGHNLIANLPDLDLAQPDDEMQLVLKLRGFCAMQNRKCVVIFDEGLPGGLQQGASTTSVQVIFASSRQTTADNIIRERIQKIPDVKNWIVVSDDREILQEAELHGMRGMRSRDFALILAAPAPASKPHPGIQDNPLVSPKEVDEWMKDFPEPADTSPAESAEAAPPTRKKTAPAKPKAPARPAADLRQSAGENTHLADDDIQGWMGIFEQDKHERKPTDKARRIQPRRDPQAERKTKEQKTEPPTKDGSVISSNSIDEWIREFGEADPERPPTDPAMQRSMPSKQGRYKDQHGKRQPTVHKRMGTSPDVHLSSGEVDAWMNVFGIIEEDDDKKKKP